MQLSWSRCFFLVLSLIFFSSCASQSSHKFLERETVLGEEVPTEEESAQRAEASVSQEKDSEAVEGDTQSSSVEPKDPLASSKMLTQAFGQQASPKFGVTPPPPLSQVLRED